MANLRKMAVVENDDKELGNNQILIGKPGGTSTSLTAQPTCSRRGA